MEGSLGRPSYSLLSADGEPAARQQPSSPPSSGVVASLALLSQVAPPFFVAGLGMVAAGLLLGVVSTTVPVFRDVHEIMILVPALLGLKGNLEMTLAARLSTHANMGDLKGRRLRKIISGNLMAIQCQAVIVGILAALVAITQHFLERRHLNMDHVWLLSVSSVLAASVASTLLGLIMIGIVVGSHRCGINPDNVAAPIAGMLGDFCTLGLFSFFASLIWSLPDAWWDTLPALLLFYCLLAAACARGAYYNKYSSGVMKEAWGPIIASMLVSSCGGIVLEHTTRRFKVLSAFAPVMNGAGGNLGAIHASRLSSDLHRSYDPLSSEPSRFTSMAPYRMLAPVVTSFGLTKADLPRRADSYPCLSAAAPGRDRLLSSPIVQRFNSAQLSSQGSADWGPSAAAQGRIDRAPSWFQDGGRISYVEDVFTLKALLGRGAQARTARTLAFLVIPGNLCFASLIAAIESHWTAGPTPIFLAAFGVAAYLQVCALMVVAHALVGLFWRWELDPDNTAIPVITSIGDVAGTCLLTCVFFALRHFHGEAWAGSGL